MMILALMASYVLGKWHEMYGPYGHAAEYIVQKLIVHGN